MVHIRVGIDCSTYAQQVGLAAQFLSIRHSQPQLPVCLAIQLVRAYEARPALRIEGL